MKIIAHRGASKQRKENTIDSFLYAAKNGADIIELDVRYTKDRICVIFHDDTLVRIDGTACKVSDINYSELNDRLRLAGYPCLLTLKTLSKEYKENKPLLIHIKFKNIDEDFIKELDNLNVMFYSGIISTEGARVLSGKYGKNRILGFIPAEKLTDEFIDRGAGIIRLWENWLDNEKVRMCHEKGVEVWIMTKNDHGTGETDINSLNKIKKSGAEGVLLNDICLANRWKAQNNRAENL